MKIKSHFFALTTIFILSFQVSAQNISPGDIIISEIMQNPKSVSDTKGEWFEILNNTTNTIDINNFIIRDEGSNIHTIYKEGGVLIEAGNFLVLGNNSDKTENGNVNIDYEYSGFSLGNSEDEIMLFNADESVLVDQVVYTGSNPWPDPDGASMELKQEYFNHIENDNGYNWQEGSEIFGDGDSGTPGAQNTISTLHNISIRNNKETNIDIFPNPALNTINIKLPVIYNNYVLVRILNITGSVVYTSTHIKNKNHMQININALNPGLYFIQLIDEAEVWIGKFIKK